MLTLRPDQRPATIEVMVEGNAVTVPRGASAAAAVLLAGVPKIRSTAVTGANRLPYCMMGICFDCLAEVDGVPNMQACMVTVAPGMQISMQNGPRSAYQEGGVE